MQFIVCYDRSDIPATFAYIGDIDCAYQSLSAIHKRTPKTFNIFEAKKFIGRLLTDERFKYYIKPVEE